jgi:hypothetical protein
MQREDVMRAGSVVGIILIVLGIILLVYFASPIRLMVQDIEPHRINLTPPILGGVALVCGIALLFAIRPRN